MQILHISRTKVTDSKVSLKIQNLSDNSTSLVALQRPYGTCNNISVKEYDSKKIHWKHCKHPTYGPSQFDQPSFIAETTVYKWTVKMIRIVCKHLQTRKQKKKFIPATSSSFNLNSQASLMGENQLRDNVVWWLQAIMLSCFILGKCINPTEDVWWFFPPSHRMWKCIYPQTGKNQW